MLGKIKNNGVYKIMIITLLAITLGSCAFASKSEQASTQQLKEKISHEIVQQIVNSNQVSVARAVKNEDNKFVPAPTQHVVTGDKVEELKKMLLNDKGYIFDKTKKCFFVPEVVFSFQNSKEVVILVNLFCNQVKFVDGDKSIIVDYDPMAKEFNAFCREILDQLDREQK